MQLIFGFWGTTGSTTGTTNVSTNGQPTTGTTVIEPPTNGSIEPPPNEGGWKVSEVQHFTESPFVDGQIPPRTSGTTSGPPPTTGTTTGGGTTGGWSDPPAYYVFVPEGQEFGQIPQNTGLTPTAGSLYTDQTMTSSIAGMSYPVQSGYEVPVQISAAGPLTARDVECGLVTVTTSHYYDMLNRHHVVVTWSIQWMEFDIHKLALGDASVDSRKSHGQPNLDGELPGDANAEPRPINFGNWVWKGGIFVGNMPLTTGDQSGTARLQLYATPPTFVDVRGAAVSLLDLGSPSVATSAIDIGSFAPLNGDTNLSSTEVAVTWTTRWDIVPRNTEGTPPDYSKDPTERRTMSGAATLDYATWNLIKPTSSTVTIPPNSLSKVCLALHNESNVLNSTFWRYFSSKEHQALFPNDFPKNDSAPRMWVADLVDGDSFGWSTDSIVTPQPEASR